MGGYPSVFLAASTGLLVPYLLLRLGKTNSNLATRNYFKQMSGIGKWPFKETDLN
jgi:hypothetical protein